MFQRDAMKILGVSECNDQKIADIMNEKYNNTLKNIQDLRSQMKPFVERLYAATMEIARFKQERMSPLIGKFFREDRSTVFMVCCPPVIKHTNKEKSVEKFLQTYATTCDKFDANEWIGFDWKAIPVIKVSVGDQDQGCQYCDIGYKRDDLSKIEAVCNFCPQGKFWVYYSTVESTACIADDPVKRFKQKYTEIPKDDFVNTLHSGIYKLVHACNNQLDIVGDFLMSKIADITISFNYHYANEVSGPTCHSEAFRIVDLFNEACEFPKTKYSDYKFPMFYKETTSQEREFDAEIAQAELEKERLAEDLQYQIERNDLQDCCNQIIEDDDDDYDLGL